MKGWFSVSLSITCAAALAIPATATGAETALPDPGPTPPIDFGLAPEYSVGQIPNSILIDDIDLDGRGDIACTLYHEGTIAVVRHGSDGDLTERATYSVGGYPTSIASGDFNRDGFPDLVVACAGDAIAVLLNRGDGRFMDPRRYSLQYNTATVAVGDLDRDGNLDVEVGLFRGFSTLPGRGDGTFAAPRSAVMGNFAELVTLGDFTGDGWLDVVLTCKEYTGVSWLLVNRKDGILGTILPLPFGSFVSVAAGDFDADGRLDLVTEDMLSRRVAVYRNRGNGAFEEIWGFPIGGAPIQASGWPMVPSVLVTGDLNGDRLPDIVVAGDGAWVITNRGNARFDVVAYRGGGNAVSVALGDLDGDGDPDLALGNGNGRGPGRESRVAVLRNTGDGAFADPLVWLLDDDWRPFLLNDDHVASIAAADFDLDRLTDLAALKYMQLGGPIATLSYACNSGSSLGNFETRGTSILQLPWWPPAYPVTLLTGDLDGGGAPDLLATLAGSEYTDTHARAFVWDNNNGLGITLRPGEIDLGVDGGPLVLADLNLDGRPDLAGTHAIADSISVWLNRGDGTFSLPMHYGVGRNPFALLSADLDRDGFQDLAVLNRQSASITILLNERGTRLKRQEEIPIGPSPYRLHAADVDANGTSDLLVSRSGSSSMTVLWNDGHARFRERREVPAGGVVSSLVAPDLDLDGWPDVVGALGDQVVVLRGMGGRMLESPRFFPVDAGLVRAVDLDNDGVAEVAASTRRPFGITILKNRNAPQSKGTRRISIDIKPGDPENTINLGSKGTTLVGLLGAADFDVDYVNVQSLALAGAPVARRGDGDWMIVREDRDGDGFVDLLAHFASEDMKIDADSKIALLEGIAWDRTRILGVDSIRVVAHAEHANQRSVAPGGASSPTWRVALDGLSPNPASPDVSIALTLTSSAAAQLRILDVTGRQVMSREIGSGGPGRRLIRLPEVGRLSPGIYFVRLTQGQFVVTKRICVVR